jgi:hypothetical protein
MLGYASSPLLDIGNSSGSEIRAGIPSFSRFRNIAGKQKNVLSKKESIVNLPHIFAILFED